ncbi:MAG: DEAD/DEAH box helicase [Candidatus Syntropharchaeia archaeon]
MTDIVIYGETPDKVENTSSCDSFRRRYPEIFAPIQSEVYERIREGNNNLALVAPTSSGKTLAIAAPIFEFNTPTVFVYPFRALVLDQTNQLVNIARMFGIERERFGCIMGGVDHREVADVIENKPFILATPDKLISLLNGGRSGEKAMLNIISAYNFVFDEIHAYNLLMRTSLIYFIRSVLDWRKDLGNVGFYFLSATFPEGLWNILRKELGMSKSDRIEGISYTGDITLRIKPFKESIYGDEIPIVKDIKACGIESDLVCIFNTAIKAWQVAEGLFGGEATGRIFVGQDKMSEKEREENFRGFTEGRSEALIGSPAIEAGVDFTAKNLVIEETFTDSFLQRFGRAARSGKDAFVLAYSDILDKLNRNGKLKEEYERKEFLELIQRNFTVRESVKIFEGLAAYPYYKFWRGESNIFEKEHLNICEELEEKGVEDFIAFRGFAPYMKYETGERIGFKSLFRKNLPIRDGKVVGRPDVRRYFFAKRRNPVPADLLKAPLYDMVNESKVFLCEVKFHLDKARKYWTVLEIAPKNDPDGDDNILLRIPGRGEFGVRNGSKNYNVRFFEVGG